MCRVLLRLCSPVGEFQRWAQSCRLWFGPVVPVKSGFNESGRCRTLWACVCSAAYWQQPQLGRLPSHGVCPQILSPRRRVRDGALDVNLVSMVPSPHPRPWRQVVDPHWSGVWSVFPRTCPSACLAFCTLPHGLMGVIWFSVCGTLTLKRASEQGPLSLSCPILASLGLCEQRSVG